MLSSDGLASHPPHARFFSLHRSFVRSFHRLPARSFLRIQLCFIYVFVCVRVDAYGKRIHVAQQCANNNHVKSGYFENGNCFRWELNFESFKYFMWIQCYFVIFRFCFVSSLVVYPFLIRIFWRALSMYVYVSDITLTTWESWDHKLNHWFE